MRFAITTVAPVGVAKTYEATRPATKARADITTESRTMPLKVWLKRIALRVGKIIKLEISKEPSRRIPSTITIEQIAAKIASYILVLIPTDFANSSSKVIAKMR